MGGNREIGREREGDRKRERGRVIGRGGDLPRIVTQQ
jgi:hypothetical protein